MRRGWDGEGRGGHLGVAPEADAVRHREVHQRSIELPAVASRKLPPAAADAGPARGWLHAAPEHFVGAHAEGDGLWDGREVAPEGAQPRGHARAAPRWPVHGLGADHVRREAEIQARETLLIEEARRRRSPSPGGAADADGPGGVIGRPLAAGPARARRGGPLRLLLIPR